MSAVPSPSKIHERFFTSAEVMRRHFKDRARQSGFKAKSPAAARAWVKHAKSILGGLLGMEHFYTCAPKPKKLGAVRVDGLIREEWLMQTEPSVWMPYYLFVPAKPAGKKLPLVLCPHGHGGGGNAATAGRFEIPEYAGSIAKYNYAYGLELAKAGFITACPEARGFGVRREWPQQNDRADPHKLWAESCHNLNVAGLPLGLTVQGMWQWDLQRLLDVLTKDPRIDARKIGCAGLSGGGLQTLNLAALEPRLKAAVVSGFFFGMQESLQENHFHCDCNMLPNWWTHFDLGDIGALIAPLPLAIETGSQDKLNGKRGLRNVYEQTRITRAAYKALGAEENFTHFVFDGPHRWDGQQSIPWLKARLGRS